ncbi:MAG: response regulator [Hyphomicrobium sp.]
MIEIEGTSVFLVVLLYNLKADLELSCVRESLMMQPVEAAAPPNQIAFGFMSKSEALYQRATSLFESSPSYFEGVKSYALLLSIIFGFGLFGMVTVASIGQTPVLLTVLDIFATLGFFFGLALLAGHIRFSGFSRTDFINDISRHITETMDRGILICDHDGAVVYTNSTLYKIFNRSSFSDLTALESALGLNLDSREALFRLSRAAKHGDTHEETFQMISASSNTPRFIKAEVAPFDFANTRDKSHYFKWTVKDVTEEQHKEMLSRKSISDIINYFDSAPMGLLIFDPQGRIRHINGTLLRWLGHLEHSTSHLSLRLNDILSYEIIDLIERSSQTGTDEQVSLEIDATRNDGRLLPVRMMSRCAPDGMRLLAFINREVEHRLGFEERSNDLKFARFFQSAPFGIASVTSGGRISSFNGTFARLMLDATGGLGKLAVDVLCRADDRVARKEIEDSLKRVLSGKAVNQPIEISLSADAVRQVHLSPMLEQATQKETAMLYVVDATQQKSLEAQFAQSSKMEAVGKLAGGIAHDFNNVLTAIIGFSDLLLQTHRTSDPAYKDIKNIQQSAYRAAGMVRQLLSFSRRQTLQAERLVLDDVIDENSSMLRTSVGEKITLKMEPCKDRWYIKADKTEFVRVLVNLAVNARDAMPNGGTLTFKTRNVTERESQRLKFEGMKVGEYVSVEVTDTGTGMSPEVLEKIFEPFFTTKEVGKGTGLGLSTVYGIVKQSGGYIHAESIPSFGTTFKIYLPRYMPEVDEELASSIVVHKEKVLTSKPTDLTGSGRVLIVEDEDVVRSFAVRALTRQGYEVLEASDGREALDILAQQQDDIDIVVTDVVMPEMDGPTMFRELSRSNPSIKVIFISGYPNEAFRETLGSENVAFLPKPFSLPELAAMVKEQLSR